jgi:type IV secretory system conjugative DNA transfer VirD4/TraG family protein/uncharacterized protein DUF87
MLDHAAGVLKDLALAFAGIYLGALVTARALRRFHLRWTWALFGLPVGSLLFAGYLRYAACGAALFSASLGARWHRMDLDQGADQAEIARERIGPVAVLRAWGARRRIRRDGWINAGWLVVGRDARRLPVRMPVGYTSGSHTLVLGATGSGKTVTEAWISGRLIEVGHGAIVIDPKGDPHLRRELAAAAARTGRAFLEWTPEGPLAYNPYQHGTATEIADKALAGEEYTEPHYLRQAQRYLGHAVRAMHGAGVVVAPGSLMAHLDPGRLELTARQLPDLGASVVLAYLDGLGERQRRELSGVRDRLSILAESDIQPWLETGDETGTLDLHRAVAERAVVYFRLDADRRQLLSQMLAAAIVSDLVTLIARLQRQPAPTLVVIDEFSAIAAAQVGRLFARARSAGISLVLGTQELADLATVGDGGLREQTLGNVETVIAHRQNVPESAELVAEIAGTRPVWITTQQTDDGVLASGVSGRGTRRRGHEFHIHPTRIKSLGVGEAVVVAPGFGLTPTVAAICHPAEAHAVTRKRRRGSPGEGAAVVARVFRRLAGTAGPWRARCARPLRPLVRRISRRTTAKTPSQRRNP